MAKNIVSLSMLRNSSLFNDKAAAIAGITGGATNDGVIKLARYNEGEGTSAKTKTIFGIYNEGTIGKSGYTLYDFDTDAEATLNALVNLINDNDATEGSFRKAIKDAVESLDYSATTEAGKFVTNVTEADGVISVSFDTVSASVVAQSSEKAAISGAATVQAALNALADKADAITISNADGSINVTPTNGGTDINVNIKSDEHVLAKAGNAGLYTNIAICALTENEVAALGENVKEAYKLVGTDGTKLGTEVKIYKDSALKEIYLGSSADTIDSGTGVITKVTVADPQSLNYAYQLADGSYTLVKIDVSKFLTESEFASGVTQNGAGVVTGVVDTASEKDESNVAFLTVGADGFKISGIKDAIDTKINKLDVEEIAAGSGKYISAISETDGKVSAASADVAAAPLNNYAKGSDGSAVSATDTVNQAIGKLENQIDAAKAAATTKVAKDANASHLTLSSSTAGDGSVTYTIGEDDIASNSDLSAETAARKAIDGQTGQTYAANGSAKYISTATSLNDADVKLDAALKAEETARIAADSALTDVINALDANSVSGESKVVIDVTQENGQITATAANLTGVKLEDLTAGTDSKIAATDTLGGALANIQAQIDAMDLTAVSAEGEVITSVSEADGKVSASKTPIKDVKLNGYTNDTAVTGDIASTDDIEAALNKLENKAAAITIANADGSINVTTAATGTDIAVHIKSDENVIKLDGEGGGIYTDLDIIKITTGLPATVKERYQLLDSDDNPIGKSIDIANDSHIVSITYISDSGDAHYQNLEYVYIDASGTTQTSYVDISSVILEVEVENGIQAIDHKLSIKLDTTGDDTGEGKFLTVGANGLKLDGVTDAIASAQSAATTVVAEGTDSGNNLSIVETAGADGHKIFTLNLSDVASSALLNTTITGAGLKDDGTYSANTADHYISGATSLANADDLLDAELFALSGKVGNVSVTGENAINVAEQTANMKDYKVTLKLNKPADVTDNLLSQDTNGLTYNPILDCGTYA